MGGYYEPAQSSNERSVLMRSRKIVAMLGVLSVVAGAGLFMFYPVANTTQGMIGAYELGFINFAGVVLMFIGFCFALVLLPVPKIKKKE